MEKTLATYLYMEVFVIVLLVYFGAFFELNLLHYIYVAALFVKYGFMCCQMDSGHGDLGTLANVVTSLASLSDSLRENLNNGDTSDSQQEEQSASDITRSECSS